MSPESKFYPEGTKDPEGYWTSMHLNAKGIAYNTKLVSSKDVPDRWEDLLDPKWKGKLLMDPTEYEWFGALLKVWGREKGFEFMKKLSRQELEFRDGHPLLAVLLAAGEFPIVVVSNSDTTEEERRKGAPVKWVGPDPTVVRLRPIGLAKTSPHPNAGKLLIN